MKNKLTRKQIDAALEDGELTEEAKAEIAEIAAAPEIGLDSYRGDVDSLEMLAAEEDDDSATPSYGLDDDIQHELFGEGDAVLNFYSTADDEGWGDAEIGEDTLASFAEEASASSSSTARTSHDTTCNSCFTTSSSLAIVDGECPNCGAVI